MTHCSSFRYLLIVCNYLKFVYVLNINVYRATPHYIYISHSKLSIIFANANTHNLMNCMIGSVIRLSLNASKTKYSVMRHTHSRHYISHICFNYRNIII